MSVFKLTTVFTVFVGIIIQTNGHWPSGYGSYGQTNNQQFDMRRQVFFQNNPDLAPENYHYQQLNGNQLVNHQAPCNCIKLKYCNPVMEMARKMYSGFIADYINSQLQIVACNYFDDEIAVCCPKSIKIKEEDSREKRGNNRRSGNEKWVWDTEELTSSEEREQHPYRPKANQIPPSFYTNYPIQGFFPFSKTIANNFGKFPFLAAHEDARTFKNCPPSFAPEFQLPTNHTFYKEPIVNEQPTTVAPRVQTDITISTLPSIFSTVEMQTKMRMINDESCGKSIGSRIVGGEDAGIGRFSWMARLAYRNKSSGSISYRCAGSLIADKWLITAGHCVTNLVESLQLTMIRLGDVDAEQDNECNRDGLCMQEEDFEIDRIVVHPNYNNPRYSNDIALIKLKESTAASPSIGPICLPIGGHEQASKNLAAGSNAIIAGWGARTRSSEAQSPMLQWIRLPFVDTTRCASFYANYTSSFKSRIMISASQICIQGRDNMDACAGDSGGPLMNEADLGDDTFVLIGLVSFGPRLCGLSNFPGVYTRVSSYMEWILRNIEP